MTPSFHTASDHQAGVEGYGEKQPGQSADPLPMLFYRTIFDIDNTPVANDQAVCKTHEDRVSNFAFSVGLPGAMFFSQVDPQLLTGYIEHKILQLDL